MPRLSVCLETFWPELPFAERLAPARAAGVRAVEFWSWRNKDLPALERALGETGLEVAAFCCEGGPALTAPGADASALVRGVAESAAVARRLGCARLIVTTGPAPAGETFAETAARVAVKLHAMGRAASDAGVTLALEPLNTRVDHPGYWLTTLAEAALLLDAVALPSVRLLHDLYHQHVTEGRAAALAVEHLARTAHFHAAGVPGRHEPAGRGEVDYRALFADLDRQGYAGYVGLEYFPTLPAAESLAQSLALAA